jgi:hypothetical protein
VERRENVAKIYTYLIIVGIGAAAVVAFALYFVNLGKSKCEGAYAQAQANITQNAQNIHQEFIGMSVLANAKRLCESKACVGGCEWRENKCIARNDKLSGTK